MEQTGIITAANKSAGRTVVRALRILAPGTVPCAPRRPPRAATAARFTVCLPPS
nr:hypothetical protein [Streptomyces sp. SID8382]